jgi:hypothetical protein
MGSINEVSLQELYDQLVDTLSQLLEARKNNVSKKELDNIAIKLELLLKNIKSSES